MVELLFHCALNAGPWGSVWSSPIGRVPNSHEVRVHFAAAVREGYTVYLRAAARTFRFHNHTHGSHLTLRITNGLGSLCRTQDEGDRT